MKLNIQLFAEGTIDGTWTKGTGGSGTCDCKIDWSSTNSGPAGNSSNVTATMYVRKAGSTSSPTTGTFSGKIIINGSEFSISKKLKNYYWGNVWKEIGSATLENIPHNNDGTKIINISGNLKQTGTSMAGTYKANADVELDHILRKSEMLDVYGYYVDEPLTIRMTSYGLPNSLKILYPNGTQVTSFDNVDDNFTFSFSQNELSNIYNYFPNSNEITLQFKINTYSAEPKTVSTFIGQSIIVVTLHLNIYSPDLMPDFNANPCFSVSDYNPTTFNLASPNFIAGYSNLRYTFVNNPVSTKYNSNISYYSVLNSNANYQNVGSSVSTIDFNNWNSSTVGVSVVDTRGSSNEQIYGIPLITDYFAPYGSINAERVDGVGERVLLDIDINYYDGDFGKPSNGYNTINEVYYRVRTSSGSFGSWVDIKNDVSISNGKLTVSNLRIFDNGSDFTLGTRYVVELKVIDGKTGINFNEVTGITTTITDGTVLDSYYKNSNGDYKYAINKLVDKNGATLQVNGDLSVSGGYIARELTNENILTLKPGLYFKEGSTGWVENGWPAVFWHATLNVSGSTYDDNNGYRVLEVIAPDNRVYRKTQSWNTWSEWINVNENYSTNEVEIGTWTNGATLYRKVFDGYLNSSGTLDNNITVPGTIQRIEGYVYSIYANWWKIGSHYFPEPQYDSCFTIPQSSASFNIKTNGYFNQNSKYIVIVEYTK